MLLGLSGASGLCHRVPRRFAPIVQLAKSPDDFYFRGFLLEGRALYRVLRNGVGKLWEVDIR